MERGISPRRMEGWEPREFIEIEYDNEGRAVRHIVTREPEWDDEDRALIAGYLQYESELCPACGEHTEETMWRIPEQSDQGVRTYFLTHPKARWHAAFFTCRGCVAREKAQAAQERRDESARKAAKSARQRLDLYPGARHWFMIDRERMHFDPPEPDG